MNRPLAIVVGISLLLIVVAGVIGWSTSLLPGGGMRLGGSLLGIHVPEDVWKGVIQCAENQKRLYQSIQYAQDRDEMPEDPADFEIKGFPASMVWKCPACERGYDLYLENWDDPDRVLIADQENRHVTSFGLWMRGIHPQVQTMGDGTIQLFEGGRIATMKGARNP